MPAGMLAGLVIALWAIVAVQSLEDPHPPVYEYRQLSFKGGDVASTLNAEPGWEVSAYLADKGQVHGVLLRRPVRRP